MCTVEFYNLTHIAPNAILSKTMFLPKEHEGRPTAWLLPLDGKWEDYEFKEGYIWQHCERLLIRTNMMVPVPRTRWLCVDKKGKDHYVTQDYMEALDIGQGSYEACEAIIRLYNM